MDFKALCVPLTPGLTKTLRVMRLTAILLLAACLHVSAKGWAQTITLSETNASLKKVFNLIEKQAGVTFYYKEELLNSAKNIDIHVNNASLTTVLDKCFEGQSFTYEVIGNTIVVKARPSPTPDLSRRVISPSSSEPPPTDIHGRVTDGTGKPMQGVTVTEKGTKNATETDDKGKYTLTVANDKSVVIFSYVGYETQRLTGKDIAAGSTVILKPAENNLQGVVISKGYYNEKRELSVSDVGVVDAKTIEEQPVSDPIQALIGRVAGLNIQQTSGEPGANALIYIRGKNSIGNGNDPFYVVDGVPFTSGSLSNSFFDIGLGLGANRSGINTGSGLSPFNVINPDDIENIEILKDADATSIYGSRGANGVVLITTKKGKAGDTKVSVDLSQGIGQVGHFMNLLNTQQYLKMMHQAYANDGLTFPSIATNPSDNNYDINGLWDTARYTDWQKVLIGGTAQYTNAQASVSGGNTNTQFLVGVGYNRQTSVYSPDNGAGDEKGSLHFSLNHASSNQKFHMQLTGSYGYENNNVPATDLTQNITLAPDGPALHNPDGSFNWYIYNGNFTFFNPIAFTVDNVNSTANNVTGNMDLSYRILPGLTIKSNFGYDRNELLFTDLSPAAGYPPPYNTNPSLRSSETASSYKQGWIIEPQLTYERKIAKGDLNVLLGGTLQQQSYQSQGIYAYDFASDALISDPQAATYFEPQGFTANFDRYQALIGRISYNWDGKYLLNLTANHDGSSRFGPGRQFANFGSVGTGWIFTKEKFMADALPWLSFGKLRLSYGTTGNYQIGYYQYLNTYSPQSNSYQGISVLSPNGLTNPNYAWELDKKLEGGLELAFLKDRINLSVSYYRNRTGNQLVGYQLPSIAGYTSVLANLPADVQNTGIEINLNSVNIKTTDFRWSTSINFTAPQNKLLSFTDLAQSPYASIYAIGKSLYSHYLYQYTGVNPQTGLYSFKTANNSGLPSFPQDGAISQPITQKYYGGIGNDFGYKSFSLDIFFQFVDQLGYNYQNYFSSPGFSDNYNEPKAILSAWTTAGQTSSVQKYGTTSATGNYYLDFQQGNGVLTNASFVRLKNVSLSYRLPASWQQRAHVQNAKVYVQGQNLYTFTHYLGLDPETSGLVLPPLRTIVAGFSISF
jgi:TonB-linked SusC/RagA family outer membrane protein